MNDAADQWMVDVTEHKHIMDIKKPVRSTNNQNYNTQICHILDHGEKLKQFDLAMSMQ